MAVAEKISDIKIYPCMIEKITEEPFKNWFDPKNPESGTVYFHLMLDNGYFETRIMGKDIFSGIEDLSPGKLFYKFIKSGPGYSELAVEDEGFETDEMYFNEFYNEFEGLKELRTNYLRETHLDELLDDES